MSKPPKPARKSVNARLLFLKQFLSSPRYLGSITPSSHYLVQRLVGLSHISQSKQVVELGPGTGPFTTGLLSHLPRDGRLLCIERDAELADHLRLRFNDERLAVVAGDAQDLRRHLREHQFASQVPLIVSGLPFTSLPVEVREAILLGIVESLRRDGEFLLYQYSYAMRNHLRRHFRTIESEWEVRNIPPAVCMRCSL
jgi:phospholipid N-methyltransferase